MRTSLTAALCFVVATTVFAETDNFDTAKVGPPPADWICGVTGRGTPQWTIAADPSAPSQPNVLKQSGRGGFPWCVKKAVAITDGFVEVKFKPLEGREDQAGGLVWRWKDGDNYYVARANALENNVSLYYTENGSRNTIKYVDAPVAAKQWHVLRIDFESKQIKVTLDGKVYIDVEHDRFTAAGAVGVWTKADSVTAFDDFSFAAK